MVTKNPSPTLSQQQTMLIADMFANRKAQRDANAPAAATYLAQMIAHDIVPATTKIELDRANGNVSPYINLDSIYGKSRTEIAERGIINANGVFNYRVNKEFISRSGYGYDFKRKKVVLNNGKIGCLANTPEQRNDENIIVSQFTVFWMRLHNMFIHSGIASSFEQAQALTIKTFQLVTIEYVLRNVVQEDIFDLYFRESKQPPFIIDLNQGIPLFFSRGTFRFGHSMVRQEYQLFQKQNGQFKRLNSQNIFHKHKDIPNDGFIDFELFFRSRKASSNGGSPVTQMHAHSIDTNLTAGMSAIGQTDGKKVNIAQRNLQPFPTQNLDSGQALHRYLSDNLPNPLLAKLGQQLNNQELAKTKIPSRLLLNISPWLYVLAEAEIRTGGKTLGPLGSILNIEVLRSAIAPPESANSTYPSIHTSPTYSFSGAIKSLGLWGTKLKNAGLTQEHCHKDLMLLILQQLKKEEEK